MSFPPALDCFSVAFIFRDVGFDPTVPQQLPRCARIKATIHVEYGTFVAQSTALHVCEHLFKRLFKHIAVVMVASNHPRSGDNIAVAISHWQDVARLGLLSTLIGDFFAPFLQHYGCRQG